MTNEEAQIIIGNIPIKPEVLDDCYDITEYQEAKTMAIEALAQESITWIVGKDNCQVAVRNMPTDKMQKICAIIGEEEQQSCEDCISRTDLIAAMHLIMDDAKIGDNDEDYESLDDIKEQYIEIAKGMASVKVQRKRGKWIVVREEYKFMGGIVNEPRGCKCSNCNKVVRFKSDFCPNCGAEMMEVEE